MSKIFAVEFLGKNISVTSNLFSVYIFIIYHDELLIFFLLWMINVEQKE